MNTRLILVRHGETQWNKEGIFRGISDVPLNEHGVSQAQALGRSLAQAGAVAVYSSRLKRAMDTARAIARGHLPELSPVEEPGLIDIHRGSWEGLTHAAAKEKFPDLYRKWFDAPQSVTFPGGESLSDVGRRAMQCVQKVAQAHEGKAVVLVTHHVVLRVLLCGLLDIGVSHFRRFDAFPGSVSEVERQYGQWVLTKLNDTRSSNG